MNKNKSKNEFECHKKRVTLIMQFVQILNKRIAFLQKLQKLLNSNIPNQKKVDRFIKLLRIHLTQMQNEQNNIKREVNRLTKEIEALG